MMSGTSKEYLHVVFFLVTYFAGSLDVSHLPSSVILCIHSQAPQYPPKYAAVTSVLHSTLLLSAGHSSHYFPMGPAVHSPTVQCRCPAVPSSAAPWTSRLQGFISGISWPSSHLMDSKARRGVSPHIFATSVFIALCGAFSPL